MRNVYKTALLPYERARLFEMVNDVGSYPEFIRWCSKADVLSQDDTQVTASLLLQARGMSEIVTTRNVLHPPERIDLQLVDGPFQTFEGGWRFSDLSSKHHAGTKVELDLNFSFSSLLLNATFGRVFTRVANTMVDSFCERAHSLLKQ